MCFVVFGLCCLIWMVFWLIVYLIWVWWLMLCVLSVVWFCCCWSVIDYWLVLGFGVCCVWFLILIWIMLVMNCLNRSFLFIMKFVWWSVFGFFMKWINCWRCWCKVGCYGGWWLISFIVLLCCWFGLCVFLILWVLLLVVIWFFMLNFILSYCWRLFGVWRCCWCSVFMWGMINVIFRLGGLLVCLWWLCIMVILDWGLMYWFGVLMLRFFCFFRFCNCWNCFKFGYLGVVLVLMWVWICSRVCWGFVIL